MSLTLHRFAISICGMGLPGLLSARSRMLARLRMVFDIVWLLAISCICLRSSVVRVMTCFCFIYSTCSF